MSTDAPFTVIMRNFGRFKKIVEMTVIKHKIMFWSDSIVDEMMYEIYWKKETTRIYTLNNFHKYTLFFVKTNKFCFRLAVLNFFFLFFFIFEAEMFLICSYFLDWTLQCHKEECQAEYNKNTLFHFFHSFSFKQRT